MDLKDPKDPKDPKDLKDLIIPHYYPLLKTKKSPALAYIKKKYYLCDEFILYICFYLVLT